jgi:pyridoxamine 5'-phosphate oxidase
MSSPRKMAKDLLTEALDTLFGLIVEAEHSPLKEPRAMTLATATKDGRVTTRTVLLKDVTKDGLVFFTNFNSRKGNQIKTNPQASVCFYWDPLGRQVMADGRLEEVSAGEADEYWATRPRESQIGAWASQQSEPLPSWDKLMREVAEFEKRFANQDVPRPPHWSGYRLIPERIEFWESGEARLHERVVYEKISGAWEVKRLYP